MKPYSVATADEALNAAFEAGALVLCPTHQYNIVRSKDPRLRQKACEIGERKIYQGLFSSERSLLMQAISDMIELGEDECHCYANVLTYKSQLAVDRNVAKPCPCKWPTCPTFGSSCSPNRTGASLDKAPNDRSETISSIEMDGNP